MSVFRDGSAAAQQPALDRLAHRHAFEGSLSFSRACKRHAGEPPTASRERVHGAAA